MNNGTRAKIVKATSNRWLVSCILTLLGSIAFKPSSMKDMFYVPMQWSMGLTNTQIGGALSAYNIVQTIGLIAGIYICNMFSKKYMTGGSLIGLGIVGVYLSTFLGYQGFLVAFGVMAILGEVTYWPVLLKTIRLLGDKKTQGRMFELLEMGRGAVDVIIASPTLAILKAMGEGVAALRGGLLFLSAVTAAAGALCLVFAPNDEKRMDETGKEVNKAQAAFGGIVQAIKSVDIWAVSLNGFTVYYIYCGLTYFIPFLNQVYFLPATVVGMYGITNQYGPKMVGGPVGSFMSDKVHKSSAKHIRAGFVVCIIAMALFPMVSHESLEQGGNWIIDATCTLAFGAIVSTMRAVLSAPMDEVRVPKEIMGVAMSLTSLVIYPPNAFAYVMYGSFFDGYPGMAGFRIVFSVMIGWTVIGVGVSTFLIHRIKKCQTTVKAEQVCGLILTEGRYEYTKGYHGFKNCRNWYKGDIHSHTTVSDGMLTPEQSVKLYKDNGYHFLCLSKHDIFTDYRERFNTEQFIIVPAVESSIALYRAKGTNERYKIHHLHRILGAQIMQDAAPLGTYGHMQFILPMKFFGEWTGLEAAQKVANVLRDHGCVTTYNHPIWNRVTEEEFIHTEGVSSLEIFNFDTVQKSNTSYDVTHQDRMLRMGKKINAFVSDGNHSEGLFEDSCGGWICVQSPELNHDGIVQNFTDDNYYSPPGSEIYDWGVRDSKVWIDTSNVNHVNSVCGNIINDETTVLGERFKDTLNHAEYALKGHETYIRAETVDKYGRTVWTNPIYLGW